MMSGVGSYERRSEDVGEILVKVQEDLQQLKEKLLTEGHGGNNMDLSALEQAIAKTEQGLQSQSEVVLNQINNQVQTLPLGGGPRGGHRRDASVEMTYDLKGGGRQGGGGQRIPETKLGSEIQQLTGPTPGQNMHFLQQLKAMANPYNSKNREVMHDNYGIQLPIINERKPQQPPVKKVTLGSTVEPLAVLPPANRHDPQLLPPPISEDDAKKGILSLIQRGLIPPAAELHLEPSPVAHTTVPLHDPSDREASKGPPDRGDIHLNAVKLDPNIIPEFERSVSAKSAATTTTPGITPAPMSAGNQGASRIASQASAPAIGSSSRRQTAGTGGKKAALSGSPPVKALEMPVQPLVGGQR